MRRFLPGSGQIPTEHISGSLFIDCRCKITIQGPGKQKHAVGRRASGTDCVRNASRVRPASSDPCQTMHLQDVTLRVALLPSPCGLLHLLQARSQTVTLAHARS